MPSVLDFDDPFGRIGNAVLQDRQAAEASASRSVELGVRAEERDYRREQDTFQRSRIAEMDEQTRTKFDQVQAEFKQGKQLEQDFVQAAFTNLQASHVIPFEEQMTLKNYGKALKTMGEADAMFGMTWAKGNAGKQKLLMRAYQTVPGMMDFKNAGNAMVGMKLFSEFEVSDQGSREKTLSIMDVRGRAEANDKGAAMTFVNTGKSFGEKQENADFIGYIYQNDNDGEPELIKRDSKEHKDMMANEARIREVAATHNISTEKAAEIVDYASSLSEGIRKDAKKIAVERDISLAAADLVAKDKAVKQADAVTGAKVEQEVDAYGTQLFRDGVINPLKHFAMVKRFEAIISPYKTVAESDAETQVVINAATSDEQRELLQLNKDELDIIAQRGMQPSSAEAKPSGKTILSKRQFFLNHVDGMVANINKSAAAAETVPERNRIAGTAERLKRLAGAMQHPKYVDQFKSDYKGALRFILSGRPAADRMPTFLPDLSRGIEGLFFTAPLPPSLRGLVKDVRSLNEFFAASSKVTNDAQYDRMLKDMAPIAGRYGIDEKTLVASTDTEVVREWEAPLIAHLKEIQTRQAALRAAGVEEPPEIADLLRTPVTSAEVGAQKLVATQRKDALAARMRAARETREFGLDVAGKQISAINAFQGDVEAARATFGGLFGAGETASVSVPSVEGLSDEQIISIYKRRNRKMTAPEAEAAARADGRIQ